MGQSGVGFISGGVPRAMSEVDALMDRPPTPFLEAGQDSI